LKTAAGRGRILLVEDDVDTRQFMAVALGVRGYQVVEAGSASQALSLMREGPFDLVLTDYDMPGKTGAAMIKEAEASGLLRDTPALVITAHPQPVGVEGMDLIRKPLDIDKFLLQVAKIFEPASRGQDPAHVSQVPERGVASAGEDATTSAAARPGPAAAPAAPAVELALYVSRLSPASVRAERNIDALLAAYDGSRVKLVVCDLALKPEDAERDRVIFTPTLVKRYPSPRTWVLGDLSDATVVMDLLAMSGVERAR
jgi:CheY-like chemotaxis protein